MINVGIVGYGNIGKAVEKEIKNDKNFNLVAIFDKFSNKNILPTEKIINYKDKIDFIFVCVGSQSDLEKVAVALIKNFNIIDCYDNHNRLKPYMQKLNELAKQNEKCAMCACGWDPGLFSLMRGLISALGYTPNTFWGKGISQGHTQAIKNIAGVKDAIQFTIPQKKEIKKVNNGKIIETQKAHRRLCYVVCKKQDSQQIKEKILTMKDYFLGYKTIVKFVSQQKLNKLKTFSHKGLVLSKGGNIKFNLALPSNPQFTAKVLTTYAKAFNKFVLEKQYGAYSIFDVPFSYLDFDLYNCM